MAIVTTRWSPDHCVCVVEYQWDTTTNENTRIHTYSTHINVCPDHSPLGQNVNGYNAMLEENQRKNNNLQTMIDNAAAQLSSTGSAGGQLKNGITYNISYTGTAPNRVLNVSFSGITLTTAQKNALQNAANTKFGTGKVVIN
jgi:hypothetical protein